MAGHISEKDWATVSDEVNRKLEKLLQFIYENEAIYQELLQLWTYHVGVDQAVADQLFFSTNGGQPASEAQVAKVLDMKNAMLAAHDIFVTSNIANIRKMT